MYLIIDIGGTKTLIAAFNHRGRIIRRYKFKTPESRTEFLGILKSALVPFSRQYGDSTQQVVIAIPGWIENNIAVKFGNRPWKNLNLVQELKKLFTCPITLKNDADLATVYESTFHRGLSLFLTFSTGIGGGLARKGQLTKNSASVEPGHIRYIFDGKNLEWEDIASCTAIGTYYGMQATSVRGAKAYTDIAFRVSLGLPQMIQKYHPDTIIIGGPLGRQFPHIKSALRANIRAFLPKTDPRKLPKITAAKRPTESVIYGGYLFAKKLKA